MIRLKFRLIFVALLAVSVLAACNLPSAGAPTQDINFIKTAAAQTVIAELTQVAASPTAGNIGIVDPGDGPSQSATPIPPTAIPATATLMPTNTSIPTQVPTATSTPLPTSTSVPTATPVPCYRVEFVRDVEVPDGTEFFPGTPFTKVWRLKNTGSCTWTTNTVLTFVRGDDMGDDNVPLPYSVRPGETVDAEVDLRAPSQEDTYKGFWMLKDGGTRFGLGGNADQPFWIEIEVIAPKAGEIFDLAENYCVANWESSDGRLDCPGSKSDSFGFVVRLNNPDLENRHENELTLWTNPEMVTDGWITGTFPAVEVQPGDRFVADIGCLEGYERCDVIFRLNYRIDGNPMRTLGEWHEVYDGKVTRVDIDMSSLAGEDVQIILSVLANGSARDDAAFWLNPHIDR